MNTFGHFLWQTWRSVVSFFMSFIVLGVMVVLAPDWVNGFVHAAGDRKSVV